MAEMLPRHEYDGCPLRVKGFANHGNLNETHKCRISNEFDIRKITIEADNDNTLDTPELRMAEDGSSIFDFHPTKEGRYQLKVVCFEKASKRRLEETFTMYVSAPTPKTRSNDGFALREPHRCDSQPDLPEEVNTNGELLNSIFDNEDDSVDDGCGEEHVTDDEDDCEKDSILNKAMPTRVVSWQDEGVFESACSGNVSTGQPMTARSVQNESNAIHPFPAIGSTMTHNSQPSVKYRTPPIPQIEKPLDFNTEFKLGQKGELKFRICNMQYPPEVTWIHILNQQSEEVIETDRIHLSTDVDGWCTLKFDEVIEKDGGMYKAFTTQHMNKIETYTRVTVAHGPPVIHPIAQSEMTVQLGKEITLSAHIHDFGKEFKVLWVKEDEAEFVKKTSKRKPTDDGKEFKLKIKIQRAEDVGRFRLEAHGVGGLSKHVFTVLLDGQQRACRFQFDEVSSTSDYGSGNVRETYEKTADESSLPDTKKETSSWKLVSIFSGAWSYVERNILGRGKTERAHSLPNFNDELSNQRSKKVKRIDNKFKEGQFLITDLTSEDIKKLEKPLKETIFGTPQWELFLSVLEESYIRIDPSDVVLLKYPGYRNIGKNLLSALLVKRPTYRVSDLRKILKARNRIDICEFLKHFDKLLLKDIPMATRLDLETRLSVPNQEGRWDILAVDLEFDNDAITDMRQPRVDYTVRSSVEEMFSLLKSRAPTLSLPFLVKCMRTKDLNESADVLEDIILTKETQRKQKICTAV